MVASYSLADNHINRLENGRAFPNCEGGKDKTYYRICSMLLGDI